MTYGALPDTSDPMRFPPGSSTTGSRACSRTLSDEAIDVMLDFAAERACRQRPVA